MPYNETKRKNSRRRIKYSEEYSFENPPFTHPFLVSSNMGSDRPRFVGTTWLFVYVPRAEVRLHLRQPRVEVRTVPSAVLFPLRQPRAEVRSWAQVHLGNIVVHQPQGEVRCAVMMVHLARQRAENRSASLVQRGRSGNSGKIAERFSYRGVCTT